MTDSDQIEGMACPQCGQREGFHIAATVWGLYHSDGFDIDDPDLPNRDNEWDQYAACICPKCHKSGVVEDFWLDEEAESCAPSIS